MYIFLKRRSYLHILVHRRSSQLDRRTDSGQDGGRPLGLCNSHIGLESPSTTGSLYGTGLENTHFIYVCIDSRNLDTG